MIKTITAVIPICWYPGIKARRSVITPNPLTATMVVRLLPMVSAKRPNIRAPTGRPTSVATKIEAPIIVLAVPLISGETK